MEAFAGRQIVIIVDDDEATRASLRFLLECEGLEVEDYPSGERLLATNWPPDVGCMILDINMPGMNGIEILHRLRSAKSTLPVIIVTGHRTRPIATPRSLPGLSPFWRNRSTTVA